MLTFLQKNQTKKPLSQAHFIGKADVWQVNGLTGEVDA